MRLAELVGVALTITLLAWLASGEFRKYHSRKPVAQYQMQSGIKCKSLVQQRCGAKLTQCSDEKTYLCAKDIAVEYQSK